MMTHALAGCVRRWPALGFFVGALTILVGHRADFEALLDAYSAFADNQTE